MSTPDTTPTDTPRTDAMEWEGKVSSAFARQLERELNHYKTALEAITETGSPIHARFAREKLAQAP